VSRARRSPLGSCGRTRRRPSHQYQVDAWITEHGLPQNIVRAVHTGRDGNPWLTTLDGLVRFHGLRFTLFDRAKSSVTSTVALEVPVGDAR
jgi:ligand-binding sensor domain-containing protein